MTNEEAARVLDEQRNKFLDEWVDSGGVNEAYNIAIAVLKKQEPKKVADMADSVVDGIEVGMCPSCSKAIVNHKNKPTRFCRYCGQAVRWNEILKSEPDTLEPLVRMFDD